MYELAVLAKELVRKVEKWFQDRLFRVGFIALGIVLAGAFLVYRYSPKSAHAECAFQIPKSAEAPIIKGDAFRVDKCVELEKASTNSARTLGLSGRQSMPADKGMMFDFQIPNEYCMWMKDMHFNLDLVWLNEQKEIIYMIEGVTPDTYPKSFCGPAEARYVVEVNAGIVKAADLRIGQRLKL